MKIFELVPGLLVAMAGDERRVIAFLSLVLSELALGCTLTHALEKLAPAFREGEDITVVFAHVVNGRPVLTYFATAEGVVSKSEADPRSCVVVGSLPPRFKYFVSRAVYAVQQLELQSSYRR